MENVNLNNKPSSEENVLAGIVGAFLFSLVGGVLWYVLYQFGFLAAISGLIGVICAIKGYAVFGKKESKKGVVISVLIAVIVIVIAWYMCLASDVYTAHKEWYAAGDIDFTVTFPEAVRSGYLYLTEPEIAAAYFKDLAIGLLLCVVGAGKNVIAAFKNAGAQPVIQEPSAVDTIISDENADTEISSSESSSVE